MERQIIVIAGPTASGKTQLAIETARLLGSEIISSDSRQFYKYLDIGTAKPTKLQLESVKHHFISFLEPDQEYNASKFREQALVICEELWRQGKFPVISGGSGLYIKGLIDGFAETPDPDPLIRKELNKEREEFGPEFIYQKLKEIDPESSSAMLPENWKRVIRALEVYKITGKTISQIHKEQKKYEISALQYALNWEREELYSRINTRSEAMIEEGLIDEVRYLIRKYDKTLNSFNTVGYKEIVEYLEGNISLDDAVGLIKRNTRRYAKRQLTWFRGDPRIEWLSIKSNNDFLIFAEKIAQRAEGKLL